MLLTQDYLDANQIYMSILYDHYKNTCDIIREAIKRRDRLMLFVVLVIAFFSFQALFPITSSQALSEFMIFKFGLNLQFSFAFIGSVVWFLLLIFVLRYFQVAIFIERQHKYIHKIELGKELITREGKSYLSEYPLFSDWMWCLYTIIFPILLFLISSIKIYCEWKSYSINTLFNTVIFILLTFSIIFYLKMIHFKSKKKL